MRSVSIDDRLWVVLRSKVISENILHEFACRCAEHVLMRERKAGREPDPRSWAAIEAKRQWVKGKISNKQLDAAWSAACNAAGSAACNAAWNAAWNAAGSAADAAQDAAQDAAGSAAGAARSAAGAAWSAEQKWQRRELEKMLKELPR
jgi:hypothetical protein